ncbi:MAG: hypothetical protein IPO37_25510 [Saprospiraceae bacterium]|nr:hypothetical protein [Saprospiraceae bacterium]
MTNTLADIVQSGIVGETQNALIAYLAYTSRKRENPCTSSAWAHQAQANLSAGEDQRTHPEEEKIEITTSATMPLLFWPRRTQTQTHPDRRPGRAENVLYPPRAAKQT